MRLRYALIKMYKVQIEYQQKSNNSLFVVSDCWQEVRNAVLVFITNILIERKFYRKLHSRSRDMNHKAHFNYSLKHPISVI